MKMSLMLGLALAALVPMAASAQVAVRGYVKRDGTYVAPHYRSAPNSTKLDNYSTRGNVNPYTGQPGTRDPYATPQPSTYSGGSYAQPYTQPQAQPSYGYQSSYGDDESSDSQDDGG
jgi:hypothetical protein